MVFDLFLCVGVEKWTRFFCPTHENAEKYNFTVLPYFGCGEDKLKTRAVKELSC